MRHLFCRAYLPRLALVLAASLGAGRSHNQPLVVPPTNRGPCPSGRPPSRKKSDMNPEKIAKVGELLKASGAKTGLVVRHGKIVGEWYFDDADRRLEAISSTRTIEVVRLDGRRPGDRRRQALARHESRRVPARREAGRQEETSPCGRSSAWTPASTTTPQLPTMEKRFSYALYEAPMDFEPGKKWDYNNTGLALLAPGAEEGDRQASRRDSRRKGVSARSASAKAIGRGTRTKTTACRIAACTSRPAAWPASACCSSAAASGKTSKSCRPPG